MQSSCSFVTWLSPHKQMGVCVMLFGWSLGWVVYAIFGHRLLFAFEKLTCQGAVKLTRRGRGLEKYVPLRQSGVVCVDSKLPAVLVTRGAGYRRGCARH